MMARPDWGRLAGTALVCFGLLVYEILSTRLLSVVLEGHLVVFAIALAMLGMGAATSIMSLRASSVAEARRDRVLSLMAMILGLSYLIGLFLLVLTTGYANAALEDAMDAGGFTALIEAIRGSMFIRMMWVGVILFIPYFFFGIFISVLFRTSPDSEYHRLYAADLIGAALGCILAVLSLDLFGYAGCLGLILVSTFLGAAAFSETRFKYHTAAGGLLAVLSIVVLISPAAVSYLEPHPPVNQLSRNYDKAYEVGQDWHMWNAHSRVALLSMRHKETGVTRSVYAHESGTGWAHVPGQDDLLAETRDPDRYSLSSLATMFRPKRVLVLFAGVGADMVQIDRQCGGNCEITGVEINRQMVEHALAGGAPGLRAFLSRPGIELEVAEAREFLERDRKRYDAILLSWWGAGTSHYVGTSGKLAQYLYTRQAFEALLDHLTPNGVVVLYNGSKAQALVNFAAVLRERNPADAGGWAMIFKGKDRPNAAAPSRAGFFDLLEQMRLVIKPSGFSDDEMATARGMAEALGFDVVLSPHGVDPRYATYRDIVAGADLDAINRRLREERDIELSVVTDNRPFFDELVPRAFYLDAGKWLETDTDSVLWNLTRFFFFFILFLSVIAVFLIIGPLLLRSGPAPSAGNVVRLFYFLALGAGFILIEVGLVRKLGLILGHPSFSISIVLAALILSTGVGSLSSRRLFASGILTAKRTALMIVVYVVLGAMLYELVVEEVIAFPLAVKAVMVIAFLFPMGFLMGQLFPQGLVWARQEDGRLVPWAWAINGTASTIAVGVGYLLSYPLGFNMLLYIGAAIYAGILLLPLGETTKHVALRPAEAAT